MSDEGIHRLSRHDWEVGPIPNHQTIVSMMEEWHYSKGAPNTSVYRHGLFAKGTGWWCAPRGGALWLPPTRRAAESVAGDAWCGVLCLSRLVVDPEIPPNAASFLLGRSMRLIDRDRWPVLLTYADTAHGHTGAIYLATNWERLGEVKAGDTWIDQTGRQVGRKRGAFSYTRADAERMGWTRMPQAPKVKFVHRADVAKAS